MLFIDVPYNFESALSVFRFLPFSVSVVISFAFTEIVTTAFYFLFFSNLLNFCVFKIFFV